MSTKTFDFEITNSCTCDDENAYLCDGSCWDYATDCFASYLEEWFTPGTYRIENWPTWRGGISGWFDAENVNDFLVAIVPDRTEWILRYSTPEKDSPFEAILSHHDAPCGGRISVYLDNNDEGEYYND